VIEEVRAIAAGGGDADDRLRQVVGVLAERLSWAAVYLVEGNELVLGPSRGARGDETGPAVPIAYEGRVIGELRAGRDTPELQQVAQEIAPLCLVAWDTGGVPWSEV
jgi:hypothetical protein